MATSKAGVCRFAPVLLALGPMVLFFHILALPVTANASVGPSAQENDRLQHEKQQLQVQVDKAEADLQEAVGRRDFGQAAELQKLIEATQRHMAAIPAPSEQAPGHTTFVIIGAGAAGLQWGILCKNAGIDYIILERAPEAGSFFTKFPRRRKLISVNKRFVGKGKSDEFALRHDWHSLLDTDRKFGKFSKVFYAHADDLARYQRSVAEDLNIAYYTNVNSTAWDESSKQHLITTSRGVWSADHLVVATGFRVRDPPACLDEEGVPYKMHTYATFPDPVDANGEDDPFCKDKPVAVLGTGNAAFETVDMLSGCAASVHMMVKNEPRFSWKTHYVGDVRMHNGGLLDHYQLKSLDAIHPPVQRRVREGRYNGTRGDVQRCKDVIGATKEFGVESVVYAGGFTTQRDGIVNASSGGNSKFPDVGEWWSDPDQPNRWFAGTLMHKLDFRKSAGGFIHGFRFHHVRAAYFGVPFPSTEVPTFNEATALATARIQNSSGLYQMSDFLVDLIVIHANASAVYYQEIPMPWISQFTHGAIGAMSIKMMFSDKEAWNWELLWDDSRIDRKEGLFVHPVITPYKLMDNGNEVEELPSHHIPEDLLAVWTSPYLLHSIKKSLENSLADTLPHDDPQATRATFKEGDRVQVQWEDEEGPRPGEVIEVNESRDDGMTHFVQYDDGIRIWEHPNSLTKLAGQHDGL